jgi:hypothetical protein
VAETNGLKNKQVKGVIDVFFFWVACAEIKKNVNFKLAGILNLKLEEEGYSSKEGHQPFTK